MERIHRIVTAPRGSWKYQDAFQVATYAPARTRDGRLVWRSVDRSRKLSEPQLRRAGIAHPHGSAHNHPVSPEEQAFRPGFPQMEPTP